MWQIFVFLSVLSGFWNFLLQWFVFVTECELDDTDKRGLVLNACMYYELVHIELWNGIYTL